MAEDRRDIQAYQAFERQGLRSTYRATGVTQNFQRYMARFAKKSQTSKHTLRNDSPIYTGQASSSGVPRRSRSQRSLSTRSISRSTSRSRVTRR